MLTFAYLIPDGDPNTAAAVHRDNDECKPSDDQAKTLTAEVQRYLLYQSPQL